MRVLHVSGEKKRPKGTAQETDFLRPVSKVPSLRIVKESGIRYTLDRNELRTKNNEG